MVLIFQFFIAVFELASSCQDLQELAWGQLLHKVFLMSFYSMYSLYIASSKIQKSLWDFQILSHLF